MTAPTAAEILASMDGSWPSAGLSRVGPFTIREGRGGGGRVSAATRSGALPPGGADAALDRAAAAMEALGQVPLFMIRPGDEDIDHALQRAGYPVVDPVTIYAAPPADIAGEVPPGAVFNAFPPLAIQREIWADGGLGPGRIAVMDRAMSPKTTLLGRIDDAPAGTVFISAHDGIAMIHALEVRIASRRRGLARHLVRACANWARRNDCRALTLVVTRANAPAKALYSTMGFAHAGAYHYRSKDGTK